MHFYSPFYIALLPLVGAIPTEQRSTSPEPTTAGDGENVTALVPGVVQVPIANFSALYDIFIVHDIPTVKLHINGSDIPAQLDTRLPSVVIGPECPWATPQNQCSALKSMFPNFRHFFRYERFDYLRLSTGLERIFDQITLGIGSVHIPQTPVIQLVNTTGMYMSAVGLGMGGDERNNSLLGRLVQEDKIQAHVFGMNLAAPGSNRGALTLGGLDRSKFADFLKRVPVLSAEEIVNQFGYGSSSYWVNLESLRLETEAGHELNLIPEKGRRAVFIDSSRTESILPDALVDRIWDVFARPSAASDKPLSSEEAYFYDYRDMQRLPVDCLFRQQNKSLELNFGEATIRVPYSQLIVERKNKGCYLTIAKRPSSSFSSFSLFSIGRSIMQSAYMVFDQDKREVWMAQALDCGSHLTAVTSNVTIGSIQGNCDAVSHTAKRGLVLKNVGGRKWYNDEDNEYDEDDEDPALNEVNSNLWDDYNVDDFDEEDFATNFNRNEKHSV